LPAIAHEAQVTFNLDDIGRIFERTRYCRPATGRSLWASDLHKVGGVPDGDARDARERRAQPDCPTITGRTVGETAEAAASPDGVVVRNAANPIAPTGGVVVLKGNLAPRARYSRLPGSANRSMRVPRDASIRKKQRFVQFGNALTKRATSSSSVTRAPGRAGNA